MPQSIVAFIFAAMQEKSRSKEKTRQQQKNAAKCRKSEPWFLVTSWLSAQQLHILLRSAPPNLLAIALYKEI